MPRQKNALISRISKDILCQLISEWLENYTELTALDAAICNKAQRNQYLAAVQAIRFLDIPCRLTLSQADIDSARLDRLQRWRSQRSIPSMTNLQLVFNCNSNKLVEDFLNQFTLNTFTVDIRKGPTSPVSLDLFLNHRNLQNLTLNATDKLINTQLFASSLLDLSQRLLHTTEIISLKTLHIQNIPFRSAKDIQILLHFLSHSCPLLTDLLLKNIGYNIIYMFYYFFLELSPSALKILTFGDMDSCCKSSALTPTQRQELTEMVSLIPALYERGHDCSEKVEKLYIHSRAAAEIYITRRIIPYFKKVQFVEASFLECDRLTPHRTFSNDDLFWETSSEAISVEACLQAHSLCPIIRNWIDSRLHTLTVSNVHFTEEQWSNVFQYLGPQLRSLTMQNVNFTDPTFALIAEYCLQAEVISLTDCREITDEGLIAFMSTPTTLPALHTFQLHQMRRMKTIAGLWNFFKPRSFPFIRPDQTDIIPIQQLAGITSFQHPEEFKFPMLKFFSIEVLIPVSVPTSTSILKSIMMMSPYRYQLEHLSCITWIVSVDAQDNYIAPHMFHLQEMQEMLEAANTSLALASASWFGDRYFVPAIQHLHFDHVKLHGRIVMFFFQQYPKLRQLSVLEIFTTEDEEDLTAPSIYDSSYYACAPTCLRRLELTYYDPSILATREQMIKVRACCPQLIYFITNRHQLDENRMLDELLMMNYQEVEENASRSDSVEFLEQEESEDSRESEQLPDEDEEE